MEFNHLLYRTDNRVAFITLNRPEKRNAFNALLVKELINAFSSAEKSNDIRVVVLEANGKAFSAGADLEYIQELSSYDFEKNLEDSSTLMRLFQQMHKLKKPIIAKVHGPALAGGCGLATVCDFIIASKNATFGYPEARIGFVAAIVMVFLVRRIGEGKARELLLTGKTMTADEALSIGLINAVVKEEDLDSSVSSLCKTLSENVSGSSIAITKEILSNIQGVELSTALDFTTRMNAATRMTEDCKRGIQAFLKKEKITW